MDWSPVQGVPPGADPQNHNPKLDKWLSGCAHQLKFELLTTGGR